MGPDPEWNEGSRRYMAQISVTTGNCLMVDPLTLPATCPTPLSQTTVWT
jgi:hypothetical protein